jgi:UDP-MurNAc hydroxylase
MTIKWINHAGFLLESGAIKMVSDPWIEGTAFDNGWKLLAPTAFTYADFENVTHIWFSHEHPDHFSPPNIKKIPPSVRSQITVLYQTTEDKKIVKFCKDTGFKDVLELPPSQWFTVGEDFKVMNQNDKDGDSWLAIQAEGKCLLNLNDVVAYRTDAQLTILKQQIGVIDVLFTQFSYANWVGNRADTVYRQACADEKMKAIEDQLRIFQPHYLVPFASYVWFCHTENYFVNDKANKIGDVHHWLRDKKVESIVLYPNDEWVVGQPHDSEIAINRYNIHYQEIEQSPELITSKNLELKALKDLAAKYVEQISLKNAAITKLKLKNPAKIYLTDLKQTVDLSLNGMTETKDKLEDCDIAVSSAALGYCLKFDWGGGTLGINARFEKPKNGNYTNIENYFYIANLNNMGQRYSISRILKNGLRRLNEKVAP